MIKFEINSISQVHFWNILDCFKFFIWKASKFTKLLIFLTQKRCLQTGLQYGKRNPPDVQEICFLPDCCERLWRNVLIIPLFEINQFSKSPMKNWSKLTTNSKIITLRNSQFWSKIVENDHNFTALFTKYRFCYGHFSETVQNQHKKARKMNSQFRTRALSKYGNCQIIKPAFMGLKLVRNDFKIPK